MSKIPKEIEDQISGQSKMYATGEGPTIDRLITEGSLSFNDLQNCCEVDFGEGAEFGYSLSLTRIGELEKENEALRSDLNMLKKAGNNLINKNTP